VKGPVSQKTYIGLLHYPVYNKNYEVVVTSITPIDIHDIARTARTYNLRGFYVINPLKGQKLLVDRIIKHWTEGHGALYNPTRKDALKLVKVADLLDEAIEDIKGLWGLRPRIVLTTARKLPKSIGFQAMKEIMENDPKPYFLLFGTGWGIADEVARDSDFFLSPIIGKDSDYNHLSVRSAVAIILDRLFGS
jgi:hypothetical protein